MEQIEQFFALCSKGQTDLIWKQYEIIKRDKNIKNVLIDGIRFASKTGDPNLITWFLSLKPESTIFTFFSDQTPYIKLDNKFKIDLFIISAKNNNVVLAEFLFAQIAKLDQELFITLFNDVCKLEKLSVAIWMYSICNFREKLFLNESVFECCKHDKIIIVEWICSVYDVTPIIHLCFEYACEFDAINVTLFLHQKYNTIMNFDLNLIINKLLLNMNINKVFKWIVTFNKINYGEFQTTKYIERLLDNDKTDVLLYLINCEEFMFPVECYHTLLKYTCCNSNCTNLMTTAIVKINDLSNVNIDEIYFVTCCLGNYEAARFLHENFKLNIRKHNDVEFAYNCIVSFGINSVQNSNIISYVETTILNYKYLNKTKIVINRKQIIMWLASLCSDYIILSDKNNLDTIKCVKINTLFERAYNSYKNNNIQKAIDIVGIKTNSNYKISDDNTCLICLDTCNRLILTNCGHHVCLIGLFDWLNKKRLTDLYLNVCPLCSQLIIFPECQIIN